MITDKMIQEAKEFLTEQWKEDGEAVIQECAKFPSLDMGCKQFLTHCTACGGNWGGMLLTGIHELRPAVWDVIPDDMGPLAWTCLWSVVILCGVDTKGDE